VKELPIEAQARLERVLADIELGIIAADQLPDEFLPFEGGFVQVSPRAGERLRLALTAADTIIKIIGALEWPAADRRITVASWHDQVRRQCAIERARFLAEIRKRPTWLEFQDRLRQAERTDIPSIAKQLQTFMDEVFWKDEDMAAVTKSNPRTVERHRMGKRPASRESILEYEKALSTVRGPTRFLKPPSAPRSPRRPKKS